MTRNLPLTWIIHKNTPWFQDGPAHAPSQNPLQEKGLVKQLREHAKAFHESFTV